MQPILFAVLFGAIASANALADPEPSPQMEMSLGRDLSFDEDKHPSTSPYGAVDFEEISARSDQKHKHSSGIYIPHSPHHPHLQSRALEHYEMNIEDVPVQYRMHRCTIPNWYAYCAKNCDGSKPDQKKWCEENGGGQFQKTGRRDVESREAMPQGGNPSNSGSGAGYGGGYGGGMRTRELSTSGAAKNAKTFGTSFIILAIPLMIAEVMML